MFMQERPCCFMNLKIHHLHPSIWLNDLFTLWSVPVEQLIKIRHKTHRMSRLNGLFGYFRVDSLITKCIIIVII